MADPPNFRRPNRSPCDAPSDKSRRSRPSFLLRDWRPNPPSSGRRCPCRSTVSNGYRASCADRTRQVHRATVKSPRSMKTIPLDTCGSSTRGLPWDLGKKGLRRAILAAASQKDRTCRPFVFRTVKHPANLKSTGPVPRGQDTVVAAAIRGPLRGSAKRLAPATCSGRSGRGPDRFAFPHDGAPPLTGRGQSNRASFSVQKMSWNSSSTAR